MRREHRPGLEYYHRKRHVRALARICLCSLLALSAAACSGGGGGEGGGGRTTKTGVRIIHASVDGSPVSAFIGTVFLLKAVYAGTTDYVPIEPGPAQLRIERTNAPGDLVRTFDADFRQATEYSVWLLGENRHGRFDTVLLEEPILRPEKGRGRLQLLNALADSPAVSIHGAGFDIGPVGYAQSSGFVDIPAGVHAVTIGYSNGRPLSQVELQLPDRGEATVVVSGSADLRVAFTRVYYDLD